MAYTRIFISPTEKTPHLRIFDLKTQMLPLMHKNSLIKSWVQRGLAMAGLLTLLSACEEGGNKPPVIPDPEISVRDRALSDGLIRSLKDCSFVSWYLPTDVTLAAAQIPKINEDLTVRTDLALPGVPPGQTAFVLTVANCESSSTDPFGQLIFHVLVPIQTPVFPETRGDQVDINFYEIARYTSYEPELNNFRILGFPPVESEVFEAGSITGGSARFNSDVLIGGKTEIGLVGENNDAPFAQTSVYRYWHVAGAEVIYSDYRLSTRQSYRGVADSVELKPTSILGTILGVQEGEVLVAGSDYAEAIDSITENVRLIKE